MFLAVPGQNRGRNQCAEKHMVRPEPKQAVPGQNKGQNRGKKHLFLLFLNHINCNTFSFLILINFLIFVIFKACRILVIFYFWLLFFCFSVVCFCCINTTIKR